MLRFFVGFPFSFVRFLFRGCGVREALVWSVATRRGAPLWALNWAFAQIERHGLR